MSFFEAQERVRKETRKLIVKFSIAAVFVSIFFSIILGIIISPLVDYIASRPQSNPTLVFFQLFFLIASAILISITIEAVFHIKQLQSKGGSGVAKMLGGKLIEGNTSNLAEQRAINVVEEMAIASGITIPPVYIMEFNSINAFTAGSSHNDAIIGVTRGCIEKLDREELQAIIAHEFSHILNGDIELNMKIMGITHGLSAMYTEGEQLMDSQTAMRHIRDKVTPPFAAFFMVFGFVGMLFTRMIQASISRQNEYLADAYAVQFTRNKQAIVNALRKIENGGSYIHCSHVLEASHLFFSSAIEKIFATHPLVEDRILAIHPDWDGTFLEANILPVFVEYKTQREIITQKKARIEIETFAKNALPIASIGTYSSWHLEQAVQFIEELNPKLKLAIRSEESAKAVICSLFIQGNESQRKRTLYFLKNLDVELLYENTVSIHNEVLKLPKDQQIILIDLCIATISRSLSSSSFKFFYNTLEKLALNDNNMSGEEFILLTLIRKKLGASFQKEPVFQRKLPLSSMKNSLSLFLSYIADLGSISENDAKSVFSEWSKHEHFPTISYCKTDTKDWLQVEKWLKQISHVKPLEMKSLVTCITQLIKHDGSVTKEELEYIRVICLTLGCPVPPFDFFPSPHSSGNI